jgi:hypothetical protein
MHGPEDRHQNPVLLLLHGPEDLLQHRELLLHDPEDLLQCAGLFGAHAEGLQPHRHCPAQRPEIFEQDGDKAVGNAEGALEEVAVSDSKFFENNCHLYRSAFSVLLTFAFPAHFSARKLDPPRHSADLSTGRGCRRGERIGGRNRRLLRQQGIVRLSSLLNQPTWQWAGCIIALRSNLEQVA